MNEISNHHGSAAAVGGAPELDPLLMMNRADEGTVGTIEQRGGLRSSHSEDSMDVMIPPDMVTVDDHCDDEDDDEEEYDDEDEDFEEEEEEEEHEGEDEEEDCDDEAESEDDEIQGHTESCVPTQPVPNQVDESDNPSELQPPKVDRANGETSPTQCAGSPQNVVHDRGLEFDMNEPWQRSLLRQFQAHYDQPRVRSPAVLMAVGHTESRDFAVDVIRGSMRDDLTLTTESSATIPHRPQVIHRPWIYPDDHSALFEDEQSHSTADHHDHHKPPAAAAERVSPRSHREERDASAAAAASSPQYYGSNRYYYDVPPTTRDAGMQAKRALMMQGQQPGQQPWLEMESPSVGTAAMDDFDDATTVAVSSANQDACFCMGYNVLDFWMPPAGGGGPAARGGGGRSRKGPRHHPSRRPSGRPPVLGKVAEEGSAEGGGGGGGGDHRPLGHQLPPSRSAARSDPDGAYNSHQYTTNLTTAKLAR